LRLKGLSGELFEKEKISENHYISLLTDWGMNENELETLKENISG